MPRMTPLFGVGEGGHALNESSVSWRSSGRGASFTAIGPLEAHILAAVWEREPEPVRVREVYEQLRERRTIAYTTVMTVMGNLVKKGLLERDSAHIAYRYRAAISPEQVAGEALDSVVGTLYRGKAGAAAARLLGLSRGLDDAQLQELRGFAAKLVESS